MRGFDGEAPRRWRLSCRVWIRPTRVARDFEWGRLPGGAGVVGARPPGWPGPRGPKAGAQQPPILISPPLERASADGCVKNRTRVKIRFVCMFGVEVCGR